MTSRDTGVVSELTAMRYYASLGYTLFVPFDHDTQIDFIAQRGDEMVRVQVKSAIVYRHSKRRSVYLGVPVKTYKPSDFDELFIVDPRNGRLWRVPWKRLPHPLPYIWLEKLDADGGQAEKPHKQQRHPDAKQWRVHAQHCSDHRVSVGADGPLADRTGDHRPGPLPAAAGEP